MEDDGGDAGWTLYLSRQTMLYDSFSSSGMQISVKYVAKVTSKDEKPERKPREKILAMFLFVMRGKMMAQFPA